MTNTLCRFCDNYDTARQGNPDLLVIDDVGARFVEIKAPGDQLRRHQLLRLEQLRASGLRADIMRVRYVLDPQQAYAKAMYLRQHAQTLPRL